MKIDKIKEEALIFNRLLNTKDEIEKLLLVNGFQLNKDLKTFHRNHNITFEAGCIFIPYIEAYSIVKSEKDKSKKELLKEFKEIVQTQSFNTNVDEIWKWIELKEKYSYNASYMKSGDEE